MIKTTQLFCFTLLLISLFNTSLLGQKFGHIDSQKFISELGAAKQIDGELKVYREQLIAATNKLQEALDQKAKAFEKDYTDGLFSKKVAEEKYAALEKEQQGIFQRRQEDEQNMLKRREDLYRPIFMQVEKAIKIVGKEMGYTFIFDSSYYNAILYIESEDVSAAVKAQLAK